MSMLHAHRPRGPTLQRRYSHNDDHDEKSRGSPRGNRAADPIADAAYHDAEGARREEHLEAALIRRLRPLLAGRLRVLLERAGELPPSDAPGALLPPLPLRFMADEVGSRPELVLAVLRSLERDGVLIREQERYRVPDPALLRGRDLN